VARNYTDLYGLSGNAGQRFAARGDSAAPTRAASCRYLSAVVAPVEMSPFQRLSPRELQVLRLVLEGGTSKEIARLVGVLPSTVDTYRSRIMRKLEVTDVPSLVRLAIRNGLIEP